MDVQYSQSQTLSDDERRLVIFFRALARSEQNELMRSAATLAVDKCLPGKRLYESMPGAAGIEPETDLDLENIWGEHIIGTSAQIIRDGIEGTGDMTETLLGTDAYDETEVIPRFVYAAGKTALNQGSFLNINDEFAREYIREWRNKIALACQRVINGMARSVVEAEEQEISIPDAVEYWIDFALTIDGERVAEELDWERPGDLDVDLTAALESLGEEPDSPSTWNGPRLSPALQLRFALYEKLRYLQVQNLLPANDEHLMEIEKLLDYLRILVRHDNS